MLPPITYCLFLFIYVYCACTFYVNMLWQRCIVCSHANKAFFEFEFEFEREREMCWKMFMNCWHGLEENTVHNITQNDDNVSNIAMCLLNKDKHFRCLLLYPQSLGKSKLRMKFCLWQDPWIILNTNMQRSHCFPNFN